MAAISTVTLCFVGLIESFWAVIGLIVIWGLLFAATMPIRQTYLNGLILPPACHDHLVRFDDVVERRRLVAAGARSGGRRLYPSSYLLSAAISAVAVPSWPCPGVRTRPRTRST